jgi:alpha-beta hydrolase superfamily lysophospholipase
MSAAPPAQPLFFGPHERRLFGWLHRPAGTAGNGLGIVLCSPSGYEAICTHRTYRHFAEDAAANGFPALRFDYDGTGNSAGHSLDPDRVSAWLGSIAHAIETLKESAGVEQVCLFGVRVGASLAAVAAHSRRDVTSLIAFAPVIKVKSYLREIRALAFSRPQREPPPGVSIDPTLEEAAGFSTSEQTRSQLAEIDLLRLSSRPAERVLIFDRDDLPAGDEWPQHLSARGAEVEQRRLDGYSEMMRDAHQSTVPTASIEAALTWLTSLRDSAPNAPAPRPSDPHATLDACADFSPDAATPALEVRETAVYLDGPHRLFGIISEPARPADMASQSPRSVVILLNSGTIHHIGPGRLYVAIARQCAARGTSVLRLDLSGVGESPPRAGENENTAYARGAHEDVAQAIRYVAARFGTANIHLVGLCSGAYHGLKAAVRGLPLRSVVVVNPLTFFWKEGMSLDYADFQVTSEALRYRKTALQLSAWFKLLRGGVDVRAAVTVFTRRLDAIIMHTAREAARTLRIPLRDDLASELRRVAKHNIDMLFVFSSSDPGLSMLHEQGGSSVRRLSRRHALRIAVVEGADHTFTAQWNRDKLTAVLMSHLDRYAAAQ